MAIMIIYKTTLSIPLLPTLSSTSSALSPSPTLPISSTLCHSLLSTTTSNSQSYLPHSTQDMTPSHSPTTTCSSSPSSNQPQLSTDYATDYELNGLPWSETIDEGWVIGRVYCE
jgi:hypothetical protein